jgi:hypothetical protein
LPSELNRVFLGVVKPRKIELETLLRTSQHGDGMYLFVPKDIVDVYSLIPGDRVKVKLIESFRLLSGVEQDKADETDEEKIEPVLVSPRKKKKRRSEE